MTKNITLRLYHTPFYFFEFAKIRVGDPVTSWIRILVPISLNIHLIDKIKVLDSSDTKIKCFKRIFAGWNPQDIWTVDMIYLDLKKSLSQVFGCMELHK